jgi:hypothetical protein
VISKSRRSRDSEMITSTRTLPDTASLEEQRPALAKKVKFEESTVVRKNKNLNRLITPSLYFIENN